MTDQEIVQTMRLCLNTEGDCRTCSLLNDDQCVKRLVRAATDLIERLTAENAALREKVPQWVSVEERLPECAVPVLVSYIGYNDGKLHADDVAARVDDWWLWWDGDLASSDERVIVKITHWMPLPPVPKKGEQNDWKSES